MKPGQGRFYDFFNIFSPEFPNLSSMWKFIWFGPYHCHYFPIQNPSHTSLFDQLWGREHHRGVAKSRPNLWWLSVASKLECFFVIIPVEVWSDCSTGYHKSKWYQVQHKVDPLVHIIAINILQGIPLKYPYMSVLRLFLLLVKWKRNRKFKWILIKGFVKIRYWNP